MSYIWIHFLKYDDNFLCFQSSCELYDTRGDLATTASDDDDDEGERGGVGGAGDDDTTLVAPGRRSTTPTRATGRDGMIT